MSNKRKLTEEIVEQSLGCCFKCQTLLSKPDTRCISISEHVATRTGGFQVDVFNNVPTTNPLGNPSSKIPKRIMFCFDCFEKTAGRDYMFSDWQEHLRDMFSR